MLLWLIPLLVVVAVLLGAALQRNAVAARVLRADPELILDDPRLRSAAVAAGKPVFDAHCSACHGSTGRGDNSLGTPDLTDREHLYREGSVAQIEEIARYGIRAGNKRGWNLAIMPAYARKIPYAGEPLPSLTPAQIETLVRYIRSFSAGGADAAALKRGRDAYSQAGCWDCHGRDLGGDPAIGAPALTDDIWQYGGSPADIRRSISRGRAGMSPAFARTLSAAELRNVAVYVASLPRTQLDRK
jgi:cytochrome c oxidase cbb3-type subunit 3